MKTLLIGLLLLSTTVVVAEARAAKPVSCSVAPFCFTVTCTINGEQIGQNISWDKKEALSRDMTYQNAAYEMFNNAPYLFAEGDDIRFEVEWPRYKYTSLTIHGCYKESFFTIVNHVEDCP